MLNDSILIIEDDDKTASLVKIFLEREGYKAIIASDGHEATILAAYYIPVFVILDLMLPGMDGLEICRALKQDPKTSPIPIIMLTAKSEDTDQVVGLELGADDYVTKPFSPKELVARVRAVLRRTKAKPKEEMLKGGFLEVDTARHIVSIKGKPLELTSKEFDLLTALMAAGGRVLSREYLLEHVWGYEQSLNVETRTVDMHIGQLRKKLKSEESRVVTVKNAGYRFDDKA